MKDVGRLGRASRLDMLPVILPFFMCFVLVPRRVLSMPSATRAVLFCHFSSRLTLLTFGRTKFQTAGGLLLLQGLGLPL